MRVFLSAHLKRSIQQDPRSQGELAALASLCYSQLSVLMHDQAAIGPVVRPRIVKLGAIVGVPEGLCFREVSR